MRLLATFAALAAAAAAQSPDMTEIMARVARNQTRSEEAWRDYTYHQKQSLRMMRGVTLVREEQREYDMTPGAPGSHKELAHFEGKYEAKGAYVPYDRPDFKSSERDIDGVFLNDLSEDMTKDPHSCNSVGCHVFSLTGAEQRKYNFELKGKETFRGREVYRVKFEPKPHPRGSDEFGEADWKGEALIDASEFQPVFVQTNLVPRIPLFVRTLLGSSIKGFGFAMSYEKFEDGIWFPVSYGGEFEMRGLFFYKRKISVAMTNAEFRRTHLDSSVTYVSQDR